MKKMIRRLLADLKTALVIPFTFAIVALTFWFIARQVFMLGFFHKRVVESDNSLFLLAQGSRFDTMTLGMLLIVPFLFCPLAAINAKVWKFFQKFLMAYFAIWSAIIVFMELVTPTFISQFDIRPNILFVEYLKYPKEVFGMLSKGYWEQLVLAGIAVPAAVYGIHRLLRSLQNTRTISIGSALAMTPVLLLLCGLMIRSTFGHRPINPSVVAVGKDLMVNSLALNSLYSVMYAIYYAKKDEGGAVKYVAMPIDQAVHLVREQMFINDEDFIDANIPTLHRQQVLTQREKPLNLVIILEESLGAEFVGSLGGLPLTPNLDKLTHEGLWFDHLYATGTRSVRGIEAIISGFVPTPAESVVKLQKSQSNFFTIAELLRRQGYETSFFYGGEAHFDNMRSFFVGNGFEKIVEQKDCDKAQFVATWGVSDEDLFNMAEEYFSAEHSKPFFSLVFSSSNHSPFDIPPGKVEPPYDPGKATVNNAVQYADYAIGQLFKKAKTSKYWGNTLFLIVADHNSRVYGPDLVPIERFHIPALILGADTQTQVYSKVASQLDLIPTLLGMMGVHSEHPAIGHDLLREDLANFPGRAIMQYNATQAYMEGNRVVVLQGGKAPELYRYEEKKLVHESNKESELIDIAVAHSIFGPYAYNEGKYRLEAENGIKSDSAAAPQHDSASEHEKAPQHDSAQKDEDLQPHEKAE